MPWKRLKTPTFSLPTRQELLILAISSIIGLLAIAFFALRP
ncbi:hypothetical protein [Desulfosporosinus fructosivorans]